MPRNSERADAIQNGSVLTGSGKEHVRDQLQIADALTGIVRDIVQRIPARRAAVRGQRIEQVYVLPAGTTVARRDRPVLLLDVGADERFPASSGGSE